MEVAQGLGGGGPAVWSDQNGDALGRTDYFYNRRGGINTKETPDSAELLT